MGFRRWLVVGLCFCVFCGCKSAQSYYDYCGPMPDEGGDFLYRKNSVLGGDPSMKRADEEAPDEQATPDEETGPEPTPAPPVGEGPGPGVDMDEDLPTIAPETRLDGAADERGDDELEGVADDELDPESEDELTESQDDLDDEVAQGGNGGSKPSASALDWHARGKDRRSPIQQVRFRAE
ncbi:MAG TPA: hypothetical protein VG826_26745 [Pirellulales bacterium]|nr:hypothetical protein [Pirellulales bacterium]